MSVENARVICQIYLMQISFCQRGLLCLVMLLAIGEIEMVLSSARTTLTTATEMELVVVGEASSLNREGELQRKPRLECLSRKLYVRPKYY